MIIFAISTTNNWLNDDEKTNPNERSFGDDGGARLSTAGYARQAERAD
jgi:hypothetical protein